MAMCLPVYVLSRSEAAGKAIRSLLHSWGLTSVECISDKAEIPSSQVTCVLAEVDSLAETPTEFLESVREGNGASQVIFLVKHLSMRKAIQVLKEGAVDLLDLPYDESLLKIAIERAHEAATRAIRLARLSPREKEILLLLGEGLQTKSIAIRLDISPRTVDIHRSRLMEKLSAKTFAELCSIAFRIRPPRDWSPSLSGT